MYQPKTNGGEMPNADKLLALISQQADRGLPAPSDLPDHRLVNQMGRLVKYASEESDIIFPEDCSVVEAFDIIVAVFMDALRDTGKLSDAYARVFPRAKGARQKTPAKEAAKLLELSRAAHRSVGEYNRELFARVGLTPMALAETLRRIIIGEVPAAARELLDAIKLVNRMCQYDEPEKTTQPPAPIVAIQNVLPPSKRQNFKPEPTDEGRRLRDEIFKPGGGLVNAQEVIEAEYEESGNGQ